MTATITPADTLWTVLAALAREAIAGNNQPAPVADETIAARLVDLSYAVQLTPPTADTPGTYLATNAGLIAAAESAPAVDREDTAMAAMHADLDPGTRVVYEGSLAAYAGQEMTVLRSCDCTPVIVPGVVYLVDRLVLRAADGERLYHVHPKSVHVA